MAVKEGASERERKEVIFSARPRPERGAGGVGRTREDDEEGEEGEGAEP